LPWSGEWGRSQGAPCGDGADRASASLLRLGLKDEIVIGMSPLIWKEGAPDRRSVHDARVARLPGLADADPGAD
jgi:hypothetical protein